MRNTFYFLSFIILSTQSLLLWYFNGYFWTFSLTLPIFFLGIYETLQSKRTLMRNYPIVGRARYWMEILRPKIYQYFIESDTDGTPVDRLTRSIIYQRAKHQLATTPFGTQLDLYAPGYEWVNHSMHPLPLDSIKSNNLRVEIGGEKCLKPYSLSLFNISAMSYGALSYSAIEALNKGAKKGNFAHNTGEGSISDYHLKHGGDLIWQIGTGLFGCRNSDGTFCEEEFKKRAHHDSVKMIEIKLSQGAKPGHGGILPAEKNTEEIARIRGVEQGITIESPACHKSFHDHKGLLLFIEKLRDLSGGRPVGIKLCLGHPHEFDLLCQTMKSENIMPDFISVDGGEGGTGAAPLEFTNSIGMSLKVGLITISDTLNRYQIRDQIKIIAAGKVFTGFDIIRMIAMGADACYSARGMMLAIGCIQALTCNTNECPTGIATQNKMLARGLDVNNKADRTCSYHHETITAVSEILSAMGLKSTDLLNRSYLWRRVGPTVIKNYEELYPST